MQERFIADVSVSYWCHCQYENMLWQAAEHRVMTGLPAIKCP